MIESSRTDRFLKKIEISQSIKEFIIFFQEVQTENVKMDLNSLQAISLKSGSKSKDAFGSNMRYLCELDGSATKHLHIS